MSLITETEVLAIQVSSKLFKVLLMEIIGWTNAEQAAEEVWCSIHSSLLSGELLLGYKNIRKDSEISRLILVKNRDSSFGIGLVTSGFTELLPSVPKEYLQVYYETLKSQKLDKNILELFKKYTINK